jgi:fatty acid desaturase
MTEAEINQEYRRAVWRFVRAVLACVLLLSTLVLVVKANVPNWPFFLMCLAFVLQGMETR